MALENDSAICVRRIEYSETSQILTLFGRRFGLMRLIAKGAHRRTKAGSSKFDGGIDLLDRGEAVFSHSTTRELPPLTEWKLTEGHQPLHRSLRAMHLGMLCAELVTSLFEEHDPHPELYDRLKEMLVDLGTAKVEETFLLFCLDLLREAGFPPEMNACTECGQLVSNHDRAYFSASRGGVICRNCETVVPDRAEIDVRLLRLIQSLLRLPRVNGAPQRAPRLTRHQTDPINRLLLDHVETATQKRLRMRKWVLPRTGRAQALHP
jgi:DNA repair protein RecO (recombination protein O)